MTLVDVVVLAAVLSVGLAAWRLGTMLAWWLIWKLEDRG